MKILTILGTRPEIIRLSKIIPKLDEVCEQVLVHTGQNYDPKLSDVFFEELSVRQPNHYLGAKGTLGEQMATIFKKLESVIKKEKPDRFLVLGDTNSSLGAIVAKRMGIPVYHMEAGNRCFDNKVPEEVNRKIIDHVTDIHMPYTQRSREHLILEGVHPSKIFVIGNPIFEVMKAAGTLQPPNEGSYYLVTLHRAENVENQGRLKIFLNALGILGLPVKFSVHPHTRERIRNSGMSVPDNIELCDPFPFKQFLELEQHALCVLTDSGTVQEECAILQVPVVTLRDSTERPETLDSGSNIVSGCNRESILRAVKLAENNHPTEPPAEYRNPNVSQTVVNILMSHHA